MNAIKKIRTEKFKVTQIEFAAIAGVVQGTVSGWESKRKVEPTGNAMKSIMASAKERGLKVKPADFFAE